MKVEDIAVDEVVREEVEAAGEVRPP